MSNSPDPLEPISFGDLPVIRSLASFWEYYACVFKRAGKETLTFFGWNRRTLLLPVLFVVGVIVGLATLRGELVLDQILTTFVFGLVPVGALAVLITIVNLFRSPHLIHTDVTKQVDALVNGHQQLLALFEPQLDILFDPNDRNCIQRNVHLHRRRSDPRPELYTLFRVRVQNKSAVQLNTVIAYLDYAWRDQDFSVLPLRTMHDETGSSWGTVLPARDKKYFDVVMRAETAQPNPANPIIVRHVKAETVRDVISTEGKHQIKIVVTCHVGKPAVKEFLVYVNENDRLCFEPQTIKDTTQ